MAEMEKTLVLILIAVILLCGGIALAIDIWLQSAKQLKVDTEKTDIYIMYMTDREGRYNPEYSRQFIRLETGLEEFSQDWVDGILHFKWYAD